MAERGRHAERRDGVLGRQVAPARYAGELALVPDPNDPDHVAIAGLREELRGIATLLPCLPRRRQAGGQFGVGARLLTDAVEDAILEIEIHVGSEARQHPLRARPRGGLLQRREELRCGASRGIRLVRPGDLVVRDTRLYARRDRGSGLGELGRWAVNATQVDPARIHAVAARAAEADVAAAALQERPIDLARPERHGIGVNKAGGREVAARAVVTADLYRHADKRVLGDRLAVCEGATGNGGRLVVVVYKGDTVAAEHVPFGRDAWACRAIHGVILQRDGPGAECAAKILWRDAARRTLRGQERPVERGVGSVIGREGLPVIVIEGARIPSAEALEIDAGKGQDTHGYYSSQPACGGIATCAIMIVPFSAEG